MVGQLKQHSNAYMQHFLYNVANYASITLYIYIYILVMCICYIKSVCHLQTKSSPVVEKGVLRSGKLSTAMQGGDYFSPT